MDDLDCAALGAALLNADCAEAICGALRPQDFVTDLPAYMFRGMQDLLNNGMEVSHVSILAECENGGMDREEVGLAIQDLIVDCPAISTINTTIRLIQERSRNRDLIHGVAEMSEMLSDRADPDHLIERMRAIVDNDAAPLSTAMPDDVFAYDDLKMEIAARHAENLDWVIPGMMRRRWRAVLVATEGAAKSTVMRQMVLMCAVGRHPFNPTSSIRPCRTLTIDAENPIEVIEHQYDLITEIGKLPPSEGRSMIWACEGGLNLRKRRDQAVMETVLDRVRPDLVTIGPIYKLGLRDGDDWDEATVELQLFLDKMRVRHNFALLLEHHAPQATSDGHRDIRPFGSSAWLRWPEFGIKFSAKERDGVQQPHLIDIGYWRPPRLNTATWPISLKRSKIDAPWIGTWPDGFWGGDH